MKRRISKHDDFHRKRYRITVNHISFLPNEILLHIFNMLEPCSLLSAMKICSHWYKVVTLTDCYKIIMNQWKQLDSVYDKGNRFAAKLIRFHAFQHELIILEPYAVLLKSIQQGFLELSRVIYYNFFTRYKQLKGVSCVNEDIEEAVYSGGSMAIVKWLTIECSFFWESSVDTIVKATTQHGNFSLFCWLCKYHSISVSLEPAAYIVFLKNICMSGKIEDLKEMMQYMKDYEISFDVFRNHAVFCDILCYDEECAQWLLTTLYKDQEEGISCAPLLCTLLSNKIDTAKYVASRYGNTAEDLTVAMNSIPHRMQAMFIQFKPKTLLWMFNEFGLSWSRIISNSVSVLTDIFTRPSIPLHAILHFITFIEPHDSIFEGSWDVFMNQLMDSRCCKFLHFILRQKAQYISDTTLGNILQSPSRYCRTLVNEVRHVCCKVVRLQQNEPQYKLHYDTLAMTHMMNYVDFIELCELLPPIKYNRKDACDQHCCCS